MTASEWFAIAVAINAAQWAIVIAIGLDILRDRRERERIERITREW